MEKANLRQRDHRLTGKYIRTVIGLVVMFGFQFIPAPAPITQTGMMVIGAFFGVVFLMASVNMIWPTFAVLVLFSFHMRDIYPDMTLSTQLYEAVSRSFGNWITLFIIAMFLMCEALKRVGVLRRMTLWFITRRIARKGPWAFTIMFFLAGLVLGSVMDPLPTALTLVLIAHELIDAMGFEEGEDWPKMIVAALPFIAELAFAMTPIGHNLPVAILGVVSGITGARFDMVSYMLIAVPVGLIIFVLMILWFRFVVKPDMSKFETVDYAVVEKLRPGRMDKREAFVTTVSLLVLLWWLVPGVAALFAPDCALVTLSNELSMLFPVIAAVALMAIVHFDGKPVLDIADAASKISWTPVMMFAGMYTTATAMVTDTVGLTALVEQKVAPAIAGFSPWMTIALLAIVCILLTNFLNNTALGMIFATVSAPIGMSMGLNPILIGITVAFSVNCAFATAAASPTISISVADRYCSPGYIFRHGGMLAILCCVVAGLLIYPLGVLFLH